MRSLAPPRDDADELLDELDLTAARGRPITIEVDRELDASDLAALSRQVTRPHETPTQQLKRVTNSHHQLAQLLARGVANVDASLITGYSPAYISLLRSDPMFGELLAHYAVERELVFADVVERMRTVGLVSLDELQRRLEEAPEKFTRQEIMQAVDLLLVKPQQAQRSGVGAARDGTLVSVNVNFVKAKASETASAAVDVEYADLPDAAA